jgi:transcriptional regulator with XRE-family HTH domain
MDEPRRSSRFKYPQVTEVAALLVPAPSQLPWFYEAPVRHWLRATLVLQGMAWARADWIGHSLVARARIENGVRQPEGWDSDNELAEWLPDSECPICDRPFKRRWLEQYYCSASCSRRAAEIRLWCEARVGVVEPPRCAFCHAYFDADYPQQRYCTRFCQDKAKKLDASERADVELGKSIANARKNARWTQADLALLVGIHERYLGSIEEGKAVMSATLRDRILGLLAPYDTPARHCVWCEQPIPPEKDPRATHCSRQCTIDHGNDRLKRRKYKHVGNRHAHDVGGPAADDRPNGGRMPGTMLATARFCGEACRSRAGRHRAAACGALRRLSDGELIVTPRERSTARASS